MNLPYHHQEQSLNEASPEFEALASTGDITGNGLERNPESKKTVERAIAKIHRIYDRVKKKFVLTEKEAVMRTDEILVATAEDHEEIDDVETALIEGSLEDIGAVVSSGPNPIDTLEHDGYQTLVTEAVNDLAEKVAILPSGEPVAGIVIEHLERSDALQQLDGVPVELAKDSLERIADCPRIATGLPENIGEMTPEQQAEVATKIALKDLSLTEKDQKSYIEQLEANGASEMEITITNRSYENIRVFVENYFRVAIVEGFIDTDEIEEQKVAEQNKIYNERLELALHEMTDPKLLAIIKDRKIETVDDLILIEENLKDKLQDLLVEKQSIVPNLNSFDEDTDYEDNPEYIELRRRFDALDRQYDELDQQRVILQTFIDQYRHVSYKDFELEDIGNAIEDAAAPIRVTPEQAIVALNIKLGVNVEIARNSEVGNFKNRVKAGVIEPLHKLSGEQQQHIESIKKKRRDYRVAYKEEHLSFRHPIEQELGYPAGQVVYGSMVRDGRFGEERYGGLLSILDRSKLPPTFFYIGDSMKGVYTRVTGVYARDEIKHGQLIFDHARITYAMLEAVAAIEYKIAGSVDRKNRFLYMEAHMVGEVLYDADHIKKLIVRDEEDFDNILRQLDDSNLLRQKVEFQRGDLSKLGN